MYRFCDLHLRSFLAKEDTWQVLVEVDSAMQNRKDEDSRLRLRREDRVHLSRGQWYIDTREGIEVGPYCSKADALAGAKKLISKLAALLAEEDATLVIKAFDVNSSMDDDPGRADRPECA